MFVFSPLSVSFPLSLVASLLRVVHSSVVSLLPFCECSSSVVEPVAVGVKLFSSSFLLLGLVLHDAARGSCVFALFAAWPSPSVPTCHGVPSLLGLAEEFCELVVMLLPCVAATADTLGPRDCERT